MALTDPDNLWTPDSGDDYALTVDLAAFADTVQEAFNRNRFTVEFATPAVQSGVVLSSDSFFYRDNLDIVHGYFNVSPASGSWSASTWVLTLPVGFRPINSYGDSHQSYNSGFNNTANTCSITTSGELRVNNVSAASQVIARGHVMYKAAV